MPSKTPSSVGLLHGAPLDQKPSYLQAAAVCHGWKNSPDLVAAKQSLKGVLAGAKLPAACQ